ARREGGDCGELRAHPSLQPDRHGRAAAAVPAGPERAVAWAHRPRGVRYRRAHQWRREERAGGCEDAGRQDHRLRRARAHRYSEGARVLPPRRHPAVRAPAARGVDARGLMKLAFFDLDGTITRHDTLIQFILGYLKSRPWRLFGFLLAVPAVLL